jgi:Flp pilus assembly protein TadB
LALGTGDDTSRRPRTPCAGAAYIVIVVVVVVIVIVIVVVIVVVVVVVIVIVIVIVSVKRDRQEISAKSISTKSAKNLIRQANHNKNENIITIRM